MSDSSSEIREENKINTDDIDIQKPDDAAGSDDLLDWGDDYFTLGDVDVIVNNKKKNVQLQQQQQEQQMQHRQEKVVVVSNNNDDTSDHHYTPKIKEERGKVDDDNDDDWLTHQKNKTSASPAVVVVPNNNNKKATTRYLTKSLVPFNTQLAKQKKVRCSLCTGPLTMTANVRKLSHLCDNCFYSNNNNNSTKT